MIVFYTHTRHIKNRGMIMFYKVDYARDGFLGLIMTFRLCKIMIGDQEDKLVDEQFDRV